LVVGLFLERLKDKPRLLYWLPGSFLFQLKTPVIALRTDSLTIQNVGRRPATNIEIVHKAKPDHFQFSTAVDFTEGTTPTGEHVIRIASLGPKEFVNLQLLSHTNPESILNVRCSEGPAQLIQVHLQRLLPRWLNIVSGALILIGSGFCLYWLALSVVFLSRAIGVIQ
jgi:energy-converting hydrogenase Eha subunit A